jgi:WD40 repeat protein
MTAKSAAGGYTNAVISAVNGTSSVQAYQWSDELGFGAKYADPSVLTGMGQTMGVCVTPNKDAVILYGTTMGYAELSAYHWTLQGGFGAKYANALSAQAASNTLVSCAMCPDGGAVAYTKLNTNDGVSAVGWNSSVGFTGWYLNPSVVYGGCRRVAFNPAGTTLLCTGTTTPYVYAYRFTSSSGFGTRYTNPSSPGSAAYSVAFSPDGNYCAVASSTSAWFTYPWTDVSGFGARTTRSGGANQKYDITWSPSGDAIAAVGSNQVNAWPWDNGTLGTISTGTTSGLGFSCAFSPSGKAIIRTINSGLTDITTQSTIEAFPYDTSTGLIGVKYSDPSVLPISYSRQVICI